MTLSEFCTRYAPYGIVPPFNHPSGAFYMSYPSVRPYPVDLQWDLFHLEDYTVTTATTVGVWLSMKLPSHMVAWNGITDRLYGRITRNLLGSDVEITRIDGCICTYDRMKLMPADPREVIEATKRGRCSLPLADLPLPPD